MKVEQQIPLLLVERQALNEAMEGEKNVWLMHLSFYTLWQMHLLFFLLWWCWLSILLLSGQPSLTWDQRALFVGRADCYHCRIFFLTLLTFKLQSLSLIKDTSLWIGNLLIYHYQVSRRPRVGAGYLFIDKITEPYRLIRRCEVTAILILYGLPRYSFYTYLTP